MKRGIDISKWQGGKISLENLKKNGLEFVMIRAGFGICHYDEWATKFYKECKELGLEVGAYWFSYAKDTNDAWREAEYLLQWAKDKRIEYPLVIDFEEDSKVKGKLPTIQERNLIVKTFCDKIEKAGYYAMFYSNKNWLDKVWAKETKDRYGCWVAHYGKQRNLPGIAQMWQYTSTPFDMDYDVIGLSNIIKKKELNHLGRCSSYE